MDKQEEIRQKGFDMFGLDERVNYGSIKVGPQRIDNASLDLEFIDRKKINKYFRKEAILEALEHNDLRFLREASRYFYRVNGIYQKVCNYYATMFRYDWYVTTEDLDDGFVEEKILKDFARVLTYLDNSYVKKTCADIALQVIINGCYYGYLTDDKNAITLQDLPVDYCRSRFKVNGQPAIEFNMRFFDDKFPDTIYRMHVLDLFPDEFKKGYVLYKQGKLEVEPFDTLSGWYLLSPGRTCKFAFHNGDLPLFINAAPTMLDLDAAQDLDRRKQMQKLLKILVQLLPRDKNGDLLFDVDEAKDIHNNAVQMLKNAVGVDVLTTFAEVKAIDTSDANASTRTDDLERVERSVYNALGVSQNLFNTEGNLSLEKSILEDEGTVRTLVLQFATFYNRLVSQKYCTGKDYNFRFYMLETTQYNYKELSKLYKEQVQIGYSKMLPQIALGHSQSSILNAAFFENQVLHLSSIMIPPMMSSTMNGEDIRTATGVDLSKAASTGNISDNKGGRPELEESEKSDKTLQNEESMS